MTQLQDFFTKEFTQQLTDPTYGFFGEAFITYIFTRNRAVQNLAHTDSFNVQAKIRVMVPGIGLDMANSDPNSFTNYPVYLKANAKLSSSISGVTAKLKKMFPKTLNSSVETNRNTSVGNTDTATHEHTNGSSSSNVNTFGIQVGGGAMGDIPMFNVGLDYSHSWESGHSQSTTSGTGASQDKQAASGTEMSVKDWSSYGTATLLNENTRKTDHIIGEVPEWVWAQSYPWDVIEFHQLSGSEVVLPQYVLDRLQLIGPDSAILLPPSHLSLLGLDFTMMAEWSVTFPTGLTSVEEISFEHDFSLISASHSAGTFVPGTSSKPASATPPSVSLHTSTMRTQTVSEDSIDIGRYALHPLKISGLRGTGIGFRSNLFDVPPTSTQSFKIVSPTNDLLVTGNGFEEVMSTKFSNTNKNAVFDIEFKTIDAVSDFDLILRHWIGPGSGSVTLTCLINGTWTETITVDSEEGRGGQDNTSHIVLRNLELTSANFHDYLVPGTNKITVTVTADDSSNDKNSYVLAAIAIDGNSQG